MKKILSILVAVIMLVGILPLGAVTASAAGSTVYTYNFTAGAHNVSSGTSILAADVKSFDSIVSTASDPWCSVDARSYAHGKLYDRGFYAAFSADNVALGKNGILFKINVAEAGEYRPSLKYQNYKTGGKLLAFIVPTMPSGGMQTLALNGTPLGKVINTYDTSVTDDTFKDANVKPHVYDDTIELTAGEHYLMFALDGSDAGAGYMLIQSLSLEKIEPAKENKYVFSRKAIRENGAVNISASYGRDYNKIDPEVSSPWKNVAIRYMNGGKYNDNGMYVHVKNGKEQGDSDNAVFPNNGLAYKIKVDENGVYTPSVTYSEYNKGGMLDTYLIDAEVFDARGSYETEEAFVKALIETYKPLGESPINTYNSSITGESFSSTETEVYSDVELKAGEYYLIFSLNGEDDRVTAGTSWYLVQSFNLKKTGEYTPVESGTASPEEVSFKICSGAEEYAAGISVSGVDNYTIGHVGSAVSGKTIKVTAKDTNDYEFDYWVVGSLDNGSYYSSDEEIDITLNSNITLTAKYSKLNSSAKVVQFFNQNKEYITEKTADAETDKLAELPGNPGLTGYSTFLGWFLNNTTKLTTDTVLEDDVTKAVAQFAETPDNITGTVKTPEGPIVNPVYGQEIKLEKSGATYWMRDGRKVAYGSDYTYLAWGTTEIEASTVREAGTAGARLPLVVIDKAANGDAYMIEYDEGDFDIVEAGILFGTSGAKIESCTSKARVSKIKAHGFFTAKPGQSENYARGYVIYKDGESFKIVYSD